MLPSNDHFIQIYKSQAAAYHALIAAEDVDGHLLPALQQVASLTKARVLDLGSGSGRVPLLLRELDCQVVAVDLHHAMLVEAQKRMRNGDWRLLHADIRQLPLTADWADVAVAGWAIGHFTGWFSDWKEQASRALDEMRRATKPGGAMLILETLGTGVLQPAAPNATLLEYYSWLESDQGFSRQVVATDYDFGSVDHAAELCGFFFGAELAARVRAKGWQRVPEFTGVWSRSGLTG